MPGYANRAAARAAGRASGVGRKMNASMQRVHNDISASAKPVTQATSAAGRQAAGEGGSGRIWPYVAGGAVVTGGGLLAYRHHNRKKKAVSKNLVAVSVSKAAPTAYQSAVWDGRFGWPGQKKGKAERKEVRRSALKGAAIGGAAGGAVGAAASSNRRLYREYNWMTGESRVPEKGTHIPGSTKAKVAAGVALLGASAGSTIAGQRKRNQIQHRPDFGKAATSEWGTNIRSVQPRTPNGRYVSHENKLEVVHVHPRGIKNSKLEAYGRGVGRRLQ